MLLCLGIILGLSCTVAQRTDSDETSESITFRPRSTTRSNVPTGPTNRILQIVIESAINNLNGMSDDDQNERNVNLYRQAIDALQSVEELTFTREELLQLSGEIRSLISANTLYNSNRCDRRSSGENDDYDNLIDDLNNDGTDNSNDTNEDDDNISARVRRVERILDAASDIIEDYCD